MKNTYGTVYTVAGYSKGPDGAVKFRVANDMKRAEVLVRNGHTQVALRVLPIAMTKEAAKQYIDGKGTLKEMQGFEACVERAMTSREAARIRAQFNERVRIAYEAA
jgi:molybdopterin biosynthesis enzyme MoaB